MPYNVYLAGGIAGMSYDEAVAWREYAISKFRFNIIGLSPMRGKAYLAGEKQIADSYADKLLSTQRAITVRDHFDTRRADLVLMNLLNAKHVSIGTMIEIGWASAYRVPIILVMEDDNLHDHAMVRECASYIVDNLDDGIHIVNAILGGA
jgi:nucleoside 2-deoxyribosyltransferase